MKGYPDLDLPVIHEGWFQPITTIDFYADQWVLSTPKGTKLRIDRRHTVSYTRNRIAQMVRDTNGVLLYVRPSKRPRRFSGINAYRLSVPNETHIEGLEYRYMLDYQPFSIFEDTKWQEIALRCFNAEPDQSNRYILGDEHAHRTFTEIFYRHPPRKHVA